LDVAVPEAVGRFREAYRANEIPAGYRPGAHLAFTFGGGALALVACLAQLEAVRPLEWLTIPFAFVYANLAEYLGHRFPMHRPWRGLGLVFKRHAGQHHRYFTDAAMPLHDLRDLRAVLFPPLLVLFFFGLFGTPAWLALRVLVSANVAWLFVATAIAYFLNYELLHLSHHLPARVLARLPLLERWSRLHRLHHDPSRMSHVNFNITYPLGDWLFGTRAR
jgi:sterol desaturase/sphingolipid hydroxylase (fatty acid hydroxylase superfamily)